VGAFFEIGDIIYPPRPLEYYGVALNDALVEAGLVGEWRKVVADMAGGPATFILPQVAHAWHVNLIALNGVIDSEAPSAPSEEPQEAAISELARTTKLFGADLGVMFDWGAERIRMLTGSGRLLDPDTALHAMVDLWCRTREGEGAIACLCRLPRWSKRLQAAVAGRSSGQAVLGELSASGARWTRSSRDRKAAVSFWRLLPAYDGALNRHGGYTRQARTTLDGVVDGRALQGPARSLSRARKGAVIWSRSGSPDDNRHDRRRSRLSYSDSWAMPRIRVIRWSRYGRSFNESAAPVQLQ
jgi:hypothetical protein